MNQMRFFQNTPVPLLFLVFGLIFFTTGCNDSTIPEAEFTVPDDTQREIVPISSDSENHIRDEFADKAQKFVETLFEIPWSELSQMELSDLLKISYEIDLSSVDEQTLSDWNELQILAKELAKTDELTKDFIRINEAFAAGKQPEEIDFDFYGTTAMEANASCEGICYGYYNSAMGKLHRDMYVGNLECIGVSLLGFLGGGPWASFGANALCQTILWLNYHNDIEYIRDILDLCLMGCEIDANS